jgi:predicted nucleic acid-binding protein
MRERLFVDTVFVIALINRRDQYHRQAVEVAQQFEGYPLLTTDAILLEIGNALSRSYKAEGSTIIDEFLHAEDIQVVHLTPELFQQAFEQYKTYSDKEWGLVDCLSFVVMRDEGVSRALTFDRHFAQAGFTVLMRENP